MVGLLLRLDLLLASLLAAADDVVGDMEGVELDSLDSGCVERMSSAQLEQCLEGRLREDLCVVTLEKRAPDALQVLVFPVDLEPARDRVHKALVALENLARAADTARGEEGCFDGAEGGERVSEP